MRKAILAGVLLVGALLAVNLFAQTKRKPRKPKTDPYLVPKISPCGVPIPSLDEFVEELKVEWRVTAASKEGGMYFYNTHRTTCAASSGIMSAWIKGTYDEEGKSIAS